MNLVRAYKTYRKELVIGLLTSVIWFIGEPIIKFIFQKAFDLATGLSSYASFAYYHSIALNRTVNFTEYLILFLITMLMFVGYIMITEVLLKAKRMLDAHDGIIIDDDDEKIRLKTIARVRKTNGILRLFVKPYLGLVIVACLYAYGSYFMNEVVTSENVRLNWRIRIISPFVSDQKIQQIRSRWALMVTKNQFESINQGLRNEIMMLRDSIVKSNAMDSTTFQKLQ